MRIVFIEAQIDDISLDMNEIDYLVDGTVKYLNQNYTKRQVGDNIAVMIRDRAHFNKTSAFMKDFESRLDKPPKERMPHVNRKVLKELKSERKRNGL